MSGFKLYPHNQQAFDETMYILNNTNKVAIVQATGSGKGVLAAEFIRKPFWGKNVLVLAPGKDIITNYQKSLGVISPNVKFATYSGLLSSFNKQSEGKDNTFAKLCKSIDLLIVDEFHRVGAEKWGEAVVTMIDSLELRNAKIIGLSATPIRYLDNSRNMADEIFEGTVVQGVTLEEAVLQGILPSFKYIVSMYGYKEDIYKLDRKLSIMRQNTSISYSEGIKKAEDRINKLKLEYFDENKILKQTIQAEIKNIKTPQKWIVFCRDIEDLNRINENLSIWFDRQINVFSVQNWNVSEDKLNIFSVCSRQSYNKENLEAFYNVNTGISIITCVDKLNEGNHIKGITGVIMLRKTISPIIYLQQMGRALAVGAKNKPIIFDFINNYSNIKRVEKEEGFKSIHNIKNNVNNYIDNLSNKEDMSDRKIVIKNTTKGIVELFDDLSDLLVINTDWSSRELKMLHTYYPLKGAKEVQRFIPKRTLEAIDAKAKLEGLVYNLRTREVKKNKDNTLLWRKDENDYIMNFFKLYHPHYYDVVTCAVKLASDGVLLNRTVNQIIDQRERLLRGYRAKDGKPNINEGKPWSHAEVEYIIDSYLTAVKMNLPIYYESMSDCVGRSIPAIKSKLKSLSVLKDGGKRGKWMPEEEQFAWKHKDDMTHIEIGVHLGRPTQGVTHKLGRMKNELKQQNYIASLPIRHHNDIWNTIELDMLIMSMDKGIERLCELFPNKTEQQIRDRVQKYCKDYNYPNPLRSKFD